MTLSIRREPLTSSVAGALIAALNAELSTQYPEPGATHFRLDPSEVAGDRGAFLVAFLAGAPVACGAVRLVTADAAELKRMYVVPTARGLGIGRALLEALEGQARHLGATRLVLETGVRQAAALVLYQRAGFLPIPPFGEYQNSPTSVCMGKALGPRSP
jgi:GNAT superfamily N-acetyltransferase